MKLEIGVVKLVKFNIRVRSLVFHKKLLDVSPFKHLPAFYNLIGAIFKEIKFCATVYLFT